MTLSSLQGDEDEGLHVKVEPTGQGMDCPSIRRENREFSGSPLGMPRPNHLSLQIKTSVHNTAQVTVRPKACKVALFKSQECHFLDMSLQGALRLRRQRSAAPPDT